MRLSEPRRAAREPPALRAGGNPDADFDTTARSARRLGIDVNILLWIILGAVAGWLASLVVKTNHQQGILLDIVVGIVGAFIGGWIFSLFGAGGFGEGNILYSLLVAFVGAVVLLFIVKAVRRS